MTRQRYASTIFTDFGDELHLRIEKREVTLVFVSNTQATAQALFDRLDTDVAQEVNVLMTAWERCSPAARAQFIYMVTGIRVAS